MRNIFAKTAGFFSSARLAAWLLPAILLLSLASQLFTAGRFLNAPGSEGAKEPGLFLKTIEIAGLDDIFSSYPFFLIIALFILNVSFCMTKRIKILLADFPRKEGAVFFSKETGCPSSARFCFI